MSSQTTDVTLDARTVASAAFERTWEHCVMRDTQRKMAASTRHGGNTELADRLDAETAMHGHRYEGALGVLAQMLCVMGHDVRDPRTGQPDRLRAEAELEQWARQVKGA